MAVSSPQIQDLHYLYASNANVSNFVSMKLSAKHNYHLWKTQMICLMESHNMHGFVDPNCFRPKDLSPEIEKQYDSLLKGWIFGSIIEGVLRTVVDLGSAKAVWDELRSFYDPISSEHVQQKTSSQQGEHVQPKTTSQQEMFDAVGVEEIETESKHPISTDIESGEDTMSEAVKNELVDATVNGSWRRVKKILKKDKGLLKKAITSGETVLHVAVKLGHKDLVEKLLRFIKENEVKDILEKKISDGSTTLHIAVSVGNEHAVKLLVQKHKDLLTIEDIKGQDPLIIAFNSMQFDIFVYLFKAVTKNKKVEKLSIAQKTEIGASLVVNAITAKQYSTALELIKAFPKFAGENDQVLMAIARTFPSNLNYWERAIYPSTVDDQISQISWSLEALVAVGWLWEKSTDIGHGHLVLIVSHFTILWVWILIILLVRMVILALHPPYLLLWKVGERPVPRIKHIKKKKEAFGHAREVLRSICTQIDELAHYRFYDHAILEAAIHNAGVVFRNIYFTAPEARNVKNKDGYDSFQLAVIYRSEKIYNFLLTNVEDKNCYRTMKDSFENNMLHLAARSAPSHVLKRRTGAALQLQRELQWFEELRKFMHPSDITKQNIHGETPPEVFTREHENLLKEGEKWMKTTAESCSISATLITTIVFAAAITVPGGSNQETGIPVFRKDIAFNIFAISDALSLFTSTSSLMVFLSILTTRFAEKDFLVSLPRRLIIGLCTLLLSITAMMVAFGATLYLVFAREKQWMVGPICGFSCLPILFFVTLQLPLIVDLYRSTYIPIFHKSRYQII